MNVQPNLSELEKSEKELYFKEYGNRPDGISLNYGIALYDIFSADLSTLTEEVFHLQEIDTSLNFTDIRTNTEKLPDSVVNILDLNNKTILDFGCGKGQFCKDVVEKFNVSKAYGTDLATIELGLADENITEKCEFISCGATSIPLPDKSVDVTTAFLVLEHVHESDIDKMFKELSRITRKGFVFAIHHGHADSHNLRRCSKNLTWWVEKLNKYTDKIYQYYYWKDNYKWGTGTDISYSRLVCKLK